MPLYTYKCDFCGKKQDVFRKIDRRDNSPLCCSAKTKRILAAFKMHIFTPYTTVVHDEDTGKYVEIKNRAEHNAFLRRNKLEEVGNDKRLAPPSREEWQESQDRQNKQAELSDFSWTDE